ncbi:hypothetical protein F4678DRAFT_457131 [Xylaria arbuscula]|nr:hypothetical protein F4678DRAFT_457131 [Xylaria arbuscula]
MRASTLAIDFTSVVLLLGYFPGISALPEWKDVVDEPRALKEDAAEVPDYDLYGGPPPNHGAYDYVTITYGGYGPPPPPSSSVAPLLSSTFSQSVTGPETPTVSSSLYSGTTFSVPPGISLSGVPTLGPASTLASALPTSLVPSFLNASSIAGSSTPTIPSSFAQSIGSSTIPALPSTGLTWKPTNEFFCDSSSLLQLLCPVDKSDIRIYHRDHRVKCSIDLNNISHRNTFDFGCNWASYWQHTEFLGAWHKHSAHRIWTSEFTGSRSLTGGRNSGLNIDTEQREYILGDNIVTVIKCDSYTIASLF